MRTLTEIDAEIAQTKAELADVHGTETEVYARITGYYRPLSKNMAYHSWNPGKTAEYKQRKLFDPELHVQERLRTASV